MQIDLRTMLDEMVVNALKCRPPTREQSLALLATSDDQVLDVVAAGGRVRRHFFGLRVKLNTIINMKSGLCPEDCHYCSQRSGSKADVLKYNWIDPIEAAANADRAVAGYAASWALHQFSVARELQVAEDPASNLTIGIPRASIATDS